MANSRRYDVCNIDVNRAFFAKHLRSKKDLEIEKHEEMVISERFFRELVENKIKKNI